jgi:hypothetical protein
VLQVLYQLIGTLADHRDRVTRSHAVVFRSALRRQQFNLSTMLTR